MLNINKLFKKLFQFITYSPQSEYSFYLPEIDPSDINNNHKDINQELKKSLKPLEDNDKPLSTKLSKNLEYITVKYNTKINSDIIIRNFNINLNNTIYKAFLIYIDGMSDPELISNYILKPLMINKNIQIKSRKNIKNNFNLLSSSDVKCIAKKIKNTLQTNNKNKTTKENKKYTKTNISSYIYSSLIPENDVNSYKNYKEIFSHINNGDCAIFVDSISEAYVVDVKGYSKRSIDTPNNEIVIRGSQEAFIENLRTNTSLLRRLVNNENLIIENINVGTISNTRCAICYIKDIVNPYLVGEVKYRINNLSIDYLISSRTTRTINTR